jgi:hypothetical protein
VEQHDLALHKGDFLQGVNRQVFRPENYYFHKWEEATRKSAVRTTVLFAVTLATRYLAFPLQSGEVPLEGDLPTDSNERLLLAQQIFEWLDSYASGISQEAFTLFQGERILLDSNNGMPGDLILSPAEFQQFQDNWKSHGLPTDLYFPDSETKIVIEPASMYQSVVWTQNSYTPLQWAHKSDVSDETLRVPTDEERIETFAQECNAFMMALARRRHEISEPGTNPSRKELAVMARLITALTLLIKRARGGEVELIDEFIQKLTEMSSIQ